MSTSSAQAPPRSSDIESSTMSPGFIALLMAAGFLAPINIYLALAILLGLMALYAFAREDGARYAVLFLALYTPFEATALNVAPTRVYFVARFAVYGFLGLCFAIFLIRRLLERRPLWIHTGIEVPLACLILVAIGSALVNFRVPVEGVVIAYQPFLRFIFIVFFFLMFIEFTPRDARMTLIGLCGALFITCLIGLAQAAIGPAASEFLAPEGAEFRGLKEGSLKQTIFEGPTNIFSTLGRYNTFGLFIGIVLTMTAPFHETRPHLRPWLYGLYAVALPCLVLCVSRTAWVATAAGVITVLLVMRRLKAIVIPVVLLLLLLIGFVLLPEQVQFYSAREYGAESISPVQRVLEPFSAEYIESHLHYSRLYFILIFPRDVIAHDMGNFAFGFGPGSVGRRAEEIYDVHTLTELGIPMSNQHFIIDVNWAFIFAQVGVVGLGAFVWVIAVITRRAWRALREAEDPLLRDLYRGFMGLTALMVVGSFFYNVWEIRPISLYYWLFAGMVLKLAATEKETAEQTVDDVRAGADG